MRVAYFHPVFTQSEQIAPIAIQKGSGLTILFKTTAETLRMIAADPRHLGAKAGLVAALHWGQNFTYYLQLHCIVPAAASLSMTRVGSSAGKGSSCPLRMLPRLFRRSFLMNSPLNEGLLSFFGDLRGSSPLMDRVRQAALQRTEVGAAYLGRAPIASLSSTCVAGCGTDRSGTISNRMPKARLSPPSALRWTLLHLPKSGRQPRMRLNGLNRTDWSSSMMTGTTTRR
ncbi:hypothetical protein [Mesorhizobium sp. L103C119B0]|uniref:hypothetical protein n=1 Tax=Mesorhizobium sp. L103C119B0 TaxID=1287085 RepID=UPI0012DF6DE2|nr:hypothetical protein [Mesorhizobium sp. L103C119B0]